MQKGFFDPRKKNKGRRALEMAKKYVYEQKDMIYEHKQNLPFAFISTINVRTKTGTGLVGCVYVCVLSETQ